MTADNENDSDAPFDPKRSLCPDGNCVGVLGPDGTCSECGRTASGGPAVEPFPSEAGDVGDQDAWDDGAADGGETAATPDDGGAFDTRRRLCSDEACIGVIGDDGRCKECGKPA